MVARPIRGMVHEAVDWGLDKEPEDFTLGEVINWYVKVVKSLAGLGTPTQLEDKLLFERWTYLTDVVAKREGISGTALMMFLNELAAAKVTAELTGDE